MVSELVHGAEAAALLGVARSDDVWRAVSRHGAGYPGRVNIIRVGKTNAAYRDELTAFAAWYRVNVTPTRWANRRPAGKPERAVVTARRAALKAAIGRVKENEL